jgi:hypothetical protein
VVETATKETEAMYESSIHIELARQRQGDLLREARNAHLAGKVERGPSETLTVLKSLAEGVRSLVSRSRQPVVVRRTLQASV